MYVEHTERWNHMIMWWHLSVCSHIFILFWLRKTSVTVETYQLSFHVFIFPFIWRPICFFGKSFLFLFLILCYLHLATLPFLVISSVSLHAFFFLLWCFINVHIKIVKVIFKNWYKIMQIKSMKWGFQCRQDYQPDETCWTKLPQISCFEMQITRPLRSYTDYFTIDLEVFQYGEIIDS